MPDPSDNSDRWQPVAAALAFLLPGAGHAYLGHTARGACVFLGVGGLFGGGLFIAGLDAVDSQLFVQNLARSAISRVTGTPAKPEIVADGDSIWFLGTMFVGPAAFIVDNIHQYHFKVREPNGVLRSARPGEGRGPNGVLLPITTDSRGVRSLGGTPPNRRALARIGEIGTLLCTIAGILNLIAIIDGAYSRRRQPAAPAGSNP
ncbi:MAG: hypothetical protein K2X32_10825 [Phycisphaerales bacterium]|nr:hypothetical protein [Phycisphaerales bacterium]